MKIEPLFCPPDTDPFDTVEWEHRTAAIKDESGGVLFEQTDCEIPKSWSPLATNVVVSKYFYGERNTPEREHSVRQVIYRVARTIADWGTQDGYFDTPADGENFYRELAWLCLHQHGAFNSPVWFNVGLYHQYGVKGSKGNYNWDTKSGAIRRPETPYEFPQASACFIQSVDDNMEDIMRLATSEAMLFKFGSGTGTDLSTLRSCREKMSGGGTPSGPLSFMKVYDAIAAVVKSGGKTRRAAKMQSLKDWHPDIMEFIQAKKKEERKARTLIESGEYEANFNGEAYSSIMFQNANLSVRVSDEFMQAVLEDGDWHTHWVTDEQHEGPTYKARDMLREMAEGTWYCGDPGVQYDTTINKWHTCKGAGRINASNPCSEYMFLDDTACFAPETRISTPRGLRSVRDLFEQQERGEDVLITTELYGEDDHRRVLAHRPAMVTNVGTRSVYRMTLQDGRSIRATGDHRFLTADAQWERVDELVAGRDRVQIRLTANAVTFESDPADARRWQMLGWLTGDGVFSKGSVALVFGPEETETAEFMAAEFNRLGAEAAAQEGGSGIHRGCSVGTQASGVMQITTRSRSLTHCLETRYGFKQATAVNKDVPTALHRQPDDLKIAYLQGLFSADGCIRANPSGTEPEVMLASSSPELLRSVQLLLSDLGMTARITWTHPEGRKNPQGQLHLYNQQARMFLTLVGMPCSTKKHAQAQEILARPFEGALKNPRPSRVVSIVPDGEETVYDITEPVTHSVIAEGMIAHNCNLASINLRKFQQDDGTFDVDRYRRACAIFFTAQEILVDHASYPTPAIAENSHLYRPLGLGFANLGSLLMSMGHPYDSDAGRGIAGALTAILNGQGFCTSAEMAANVGPFAAYRENEQSMLDVMQMHRDAVEHIDRECPAYLRDAARQVWNECLQKGRRHGYRNAQATVLAPTGTIAFMMDCDTTGIEPDIALVKYKQLAGGGMMKIVNRTVPVALTTLGYGKLEIDKIVQWIDQHDTIEGAPDLNDEHLPVFDCAFKAKNGQRSISWTAHIGMMAAAQPFLSGAISKTVNMPEASTVEDIEEAYLEGWKLGLKALAIYRDGSKSSQPLNTSKEGDRLAATRSPRRGARDEAPRPARRHLPATRHSLTHKFNVGGHEGYITVGLFDDGHPGELFITMAKEGSTIGGLMDTIGTLTSMALQYGVPLDALVNKFTHMRFEPAGWTGNPDIPMAKSIADYIFRWLGIQFLPGYREANTPKRVESPESRVESQTAEGDSAEAEPQAAAKPPAVAEENPKTAAALVRSLTDLANGQKHGNGKVPSLNPQLSTHNSRSAQFATFQADAPACDNCGAITVRNGNCYLCHNCGNSMGCS